MTRTAEPSACARPALATPAEVADHLGISEKTLAQWRWQQIGPAFTKVGGRVRYRWEAVDAYVAAGENKPA